MSRFRGFARTAVQARNCRATLVDGARHCRGHGEARQIVLKVGGHFVVERGKRRVLFGGH